MNMQIETTNPASQPFLELGISSDAADKALLLLSAGGAEPPELEERVAHLADLCQACGSLPNAKLAYSLAGRSGHTFNKQTCGLLAQALCCSGCVPAAVRLWKKALEADVNEAGFLVTAARLGEDGAEQIRVLNALKLSPDKLPAAEELARRLRAHGWACEGSWGAVTSPQRSLVWWDHAVPSERRPFGMSLTTHPISLRNKLGVKLFFDVRHEILGTTDRCHLEVSVDGKRWEKLVKFEGVSDWTSTEVDLSRFTEEEILLRFHVLSGGQRKGRGMELADLRLEWVQVTRQQKLEFTEHSEEWEVEGSQLLGKKSEVAICSNDFSVSGLTTPTVTLEARLQASSVYAEGTIEVVSGEEVVARETITPTSEWLQLNLQLPESLSGDLKLRFCSRFNKRKESDGLWVRNPRVRAGTESGRATVGLDGGFDDGIPEQKALLRVVETGEVQELERLLHLRRGLPSLKYALALAAMLRSEEQIPALLLLFSRLKEEAVEAFAVLGELAVGEDPLLQARVLLESGIAAYPSTRDHLGDGLLSAREFEDNCRLYLQLRESWSEEEARRGLSLILTPVADEDAQERRDHFLKLLQEYPAADGLFSAWDKHWAK
ncbi:MAG: hypothetical protein WC314_12645 [Vulcanimicrobiota bacterium]